ncbi:MAG: outer membrane protein assembly factor BamE [Endomicrobia bacterium]|nr:outer membrane protein assembly factor BamE [Endomicrobiia bacterium]
MRILCIAVCSALLLGGCASSGSNVIKDERLTVAKVQREIKIGMSSSDVIEVLGSPNMVTTDDQRRETWVYDKVSTSINASSSGVWLLIMGSTKNSASTSQRTLTIVIKFDEYNKVRDFAYRASSF